MVRTAVLICTLLACASIGQAQQTVTLELVPNVALDHRQTQLLITVESSQDFSNGTLEIKTSTDFKAEPATISLPPFTRSTIQSVIITLVNPKLLGGDQALTATLSQTSDATARKILVSKLLKFTYTPEISLSTFFTFAAFGIVIGYWVRLIVKVLAGVTPPSPAPEPGGPPVGPITRFVQSHYYLVDFVTTLALASIALATLVQGGRPPQAAAAWYGALASGVGLGLFTNSELLTRVRK